MKKIISRIDEMKVEESYKDELIDLVQNELTKSQQQALLILVEQGITDSKLINRIQKMFESEK